MKHPEETYPSDLKSWRLSAMDHLLKRQRLPLQQIDRLCKVGDADVFG
jgi:hypothetical protein